MSKKKTILVFFTANLLLSSFYLDHWFNPNSVSRALTVLSLARDGSFCIDEYHKMTIDKSIVGGHYYSEKAPFPAIAVTPVYMLLRKISGDSGNVETEVKKILRIGSFICGTLPFTLVITLLFSILLSSTNPYRAALLSMLPFYASFVWVFAGTFFSHVFSGSLLVFAYYFLRKNSDYLLAGILSGAAVLSEFPLMVIVIFWTALILFKTRNLKNLMLFIAGGISFAVFLLLYNHGITGSATTMLYDHVESMQSWSRFGLGIPDPIVLFRLVFGQYRGLIFYMPAFLIFIYLGFKLRLWKKSSFYNGYLILPCLAYLLVFSSYHDWWGGWSYGPRQLIPMAMLLAFEGIIFLSAKKISRWMQTVPIIAGLIMAFLSKSTVLYSIPTKFEFPIMQVIVQKFRDGVFNDGNLLSAVFEVSGKKANLIFCAVFYCSS